MASAALQVLPLDLSEPALRQAPNSGRSGALAGDSAGWGASDKKTGRLASMDALIVAAKSDEQTSRIKLLVDVLKRLGMDVAFGEPDDARARVFQPSRSRFFVVVPSLGSDGESTENVLHLIRQPGLEAFVIYVADTMSGEAYRQLVRSGSGDWVRWDNLSSDLLELLRRELANDNPRPEASGAVIAFVPTSGGVGNTTLALESAIQLSQRKPGRRRRVCVLDLNLQHSAIPDYLDVTPRLDITEIIDKPERLDDHLVDLLTAQHSSGVDLFCSPPNRLDYGRLDDRVLFALLDQIGKRYDLIHLDLPSVWFPWTENLVAGSDAVVLTSAFGIPAVRRVAQQLKDLAQLSVRPERIAVAIGRCETRLFGGIVRKSDINAALSGRKVFYIRDDAAAADEAVNTGRSIVQIGKARRLISEIEAVADWVDGFTKRTSSARAPAEVAVKG